MKKILNVLLCNAFREPAPDDPLLSQSEHIKIEPPPFSPGEEQPPPDPQIFFRLSTLFRVEQRTEAQFLCEQLSNCFLEDITADMTLEQRQPESLPRIDYQPEICMLLEKIPNDDRERLTHINNATRCKMMHAFVKEAESFSLDLAGRTNEKLGLLGGRLDEIERRLSSFSKEHGQ